MPVPLSDSPYKTVALAVLAQRAPLLSADPAAQHHALHALQATISDQLRAVSSQLGTSPSARGRQRQRRKRGAA